MRNSGNFFGRQKLKRLYSEKSDSRSTFIMAGHFVNKRISLEIKGMSSVQYRAHRQII